MLIPASLPTTSNTVIRLPNGRKLSVLEPQVYTIQLTGKQFTSQKHRRSPTFTKYEVLKIEKSNKQPTYHSTYRLFAELFTPCIPTKLSILHRKHPRMYTQTKSAINFIHHNRNPHLHPHILQYAIPATTNSQPYNNP